MHAGNFDTEHPRKGLIFSWIAEDVLFGPSLGGLYTRQAESFGRLHRSIKRLQPGREHVRAIVEYCSPESCAPRS